jgi:hypothetical protein
VFLELLAMVAESGIRVIRLRDALKAKSGETHFQEPAHIRQIGRETHQAQIFDNIEAVDRTGDGLLLRVIPYRVSLTRLGRIVCV